MATAFSLGPGRSTFCETSPNLNKDARITKPGDKAEDGNSMKVEKSPRQPPARRNRGLRDFLTQPFRGWLLPPRRR